jgi:UPF0716 family protein affecting phage T7 exclusion
MGARSVFKLALPTKCPVIYCGIIHVFPTIGIVTTTLIVEASSVIGLGLTAIVELMISA